MTEAQPFGDQTQKALGFLQELILHMIVNDIPEYKLPMLDVPLDFTDFPYDIVKHDKIIKVVKCYTDRIGKDGNRIVRFEDTFTNIQYDFNFTPSDDRRYMLVTKTKV